VLSLCKPYIIKQQHKIKRLHSEAVLVLAFARLIRALFIIKALRSKALVYQDSQKTNNPTLQQSFALLGLGCKTNALA
jgi:hypothetical protein